MQCQLACNLPSAKFYEKIFSYCPNWRQQALIEHVHLGEKNPNQRQQMQKEVSHWSDKTQQMCLLAFVNKPLHYFEFGLQYSFQLAVITAPLNTNNTGHN